MPSARRPYLMGKKSVTEFYQAPVRFLKEIIARESEFEKPYVDEDYRKMHFDFPWPDWPPFPDFPPWPPWQVPPAPAPGGNWCVLASPFGALDCEGEVTFWVLVCGVPEAGNLCNPGQVSRWIVEGDFTTITSDYLGIVVGIDEEAALQRPDKKAWIKACFTDPSGNVCCEEAEVTCKVCPPDVSINWVSDLNLTIGQGNGGYALAGVEIADGLGDYTWEVAGTGFSLLYDKTTFRSNTLQADATACGTATITVTDYCGETVTGYVRCTAGQWTPIAFTSCVLTGTPDVPGGNVKTEGKYRLTEEWKNACGAGLNATFYGDQANCTVGYDLCSRAICKCDAAGCHATMGCTKCLNTSKCGVGYTFCHETATCICCAADAATCTCGLPDGETCQYTGNCQGDKAKLEEWTCIP